MKNVFRRNIVFKGCKMLSAPVKNYMKELKRSKGHRKQFQLLLFQNCDANQATKDTEKQLKKYRVSFSYIFACRWKGGCSNPGSFGGSNYYGRWVGCGNAGDRMWVQVMLKKKRWGKK